MVDLNYTTLKKFKLYRQNKNRGHHQELFSQEMVTFCPQGKINLMKTFDPEKEKIFLRFFNPYRQHFESITERVSRKQNRRQGF